MLPDGFLIPVIALRLFGGMTYLRATLRGRAHPELLSWFLWALTPMIAFAAELSAGVGLVAYVTLALGVSPLLVFLTAVIKRSGRMRLDNFNILCVLFSILGIILWRVVGNPEFAIALAIIADISSAVPTLRKIYRVPETEYAFSYGVSATAMIIALLTVNQWTFAALAFPSYVLIVNSVIVLFIKQRTLQLRRQKKRRRVKTIRKYKK